MCAPINVCNVQLPESLLFILLYAPQDLAQTICVDRDQQRYIGPRGEKSLRHIIRSACIHDRNLRASRRHAGYCPSGKKSWDDENKPNITEALKEKSCSSTGGTGFLRLFILCTYLWFWTGYVCNRAVRDYLLAANADRMSDVYLPWGRGSQYH